MNQDTNSRRKLLKIRGAAGTGLTAVFRGLALPPAVAALICTKRKDVQ